MKLQLRSLRDFLSVTETLFASLESIWSFTFGQYCILCDARYLSSTKNQQISHQSDHSFIHFCLLSQVGARFHNPLYVVHELQMYPQDWIGLTSPGQGQPRRTGHTHSRCPAGSDSRCRSNDPWRPREQQFLVAATAPEVLVLSPRLLTSLSFSSFLLLETWCYPVSWMKKSSEFTWSLWTLITWFPTIRSDERQLKYDYIYADARSEAMTNIETFQLKESPPESATWQFSGGWRCSELFVKNILHDFLLAFRWYLPIRIRSSARFFFRCVHKVHSEVLIKRYLLFCKCSESKGSLGGTSFKKREQKSTTYSWRALLPWQLSVFLHRHLVISFRSCTLQSRSPATEKTWTSLIRCQIHALAFPRRQIRWLWQSTALTRSV